MPVRFGPAFVPSDAKREGLVSQPAWDGDVDMGAVAEEAMERGHERYRDQVRTA